MNRGKTEADTLKINGWGPGDILEGDEGYGPDQIKIIAVGNERFIGQWRNRETGDFDRESPNITLTCREWRKVGHDPAYGITPSLGLRKAQQLGEVCGVLVRTESGKQAAVHELGRVTWIRNSDTDQAESDRSIDWRAVATSAIEDISEITELLGVPEEEAHRPITSLVREYIAKTGIEPGWEVLPEDLRTHLGDFQEAISQVMATGDEDGYWQHQLQTLERVRLMLIDRDLENPDMASKSTISCGHPELDAIAEEDWS
ncbi:DUF7241 domain-containing protein [Marinobacter salsuginis]|jgi:hypothetical protein|uniref:DUF7241 domain-containing protein n=1 Tax=Marinobacter salsuginis TaxID=418719 RepID=A0A5M3Q1W2_9GAMM|nr:hypothetical protein [Marinobacter salsuginis]GBO89244.1 hypothetical protein MSSD14B_29120 [Marinobacter salsuginis]